MSEEPEPPRPCCWQMGSLVIEDRCKKPATWRDGFVPGLVWCDEHKHENDKPMGLES